MADSALWLVRSPVNQTLRRVNCGKKIQFWETNSDLSHKRDVFFFFFYLQLWEINVRIVKQEVAITLFYFLFNKNTGKWRRNGICKWQNGLEPAPHEHECSTGSVRMYTAHCAPALTMIHTIKMKQTHWMTKTTLHSPFLPAINTIEHLHSPVTAALCECITTLLSWKWYEILAEWTGWTSSDL